MSVTTTTWTPASEPPAVEPGHSCPVFAARRVDKGKWYVFVAVYLNAVEIDEDDGDGEGDDYVMSGFAIDIISNQYGRFYESINVEFWSPLVMPEPPQA